LLARWAFSSLRTQREGVVQLSFERTAILLRAVPQLPCGSMAATARPPTVGGRPLNEVLGPAGDGDAL
jgi:hypothetical protein